MRKLAKTLTGIALSLSIAICNVCTTYTQAVYGYKLLADMSDCKCYYTDTYSYTYGITTMRGAISWHNTTLPFDLYWHRTTSATDREVSAGIDSNLGEGTLAETHFYYEISSTVNNRVYPSQSNWTHCIIYVNDTVLDSSTGYDTMAHEFGHVMGLAHNNTNPNSIMCQKRFGRTATRPSAVDFVKLASIYS